MQPEQTISRQRVFAGKLIGVRVDTVQLPNGDVRTREVAEHPGAVAVLPVLPDGTLVLVRQYRHAVGRTLLEVPAGTLDPDERPEDCALRELAEETGYQAESLRELVRFFVSPGWANEELVVYVADDIRAGQASPEEDEDLEVVQVAPADVPGLIQRGEIADSKTIICLLAYLGLRLDAR